VSRIPGVKTRAPSRRSADLTVLRRDEHKS
jgi:hypothetical protein